MQNSEVHNFFVSYNHKSMTWQRNFPCFNFQQVPFWNLFHQWPDWESMEIILVTIQSSLDLGSAPIYCQRKESNGSLVSSYSRNTSLLVFNTCDKNFDPSCLAFTAISDVLFLKPTRISNILSRNANVNWEGPNITFGDKHEELRTSLFFNILETGTYTYMEF